MAGLFEDAILRAAFQGEKKVQVQTVSVSRLGRERKLRWGEKGKPKVGGVAELGVTGVGTRAEAWLRISKWEGLGYLGSGWESKILERWMERAEAACCGVAGAFASC
jgi:hypothetical protein